jgi:hypothetical protein
MPTTTCDYCGRPDENNPSDYYHSKRCEADFLREQIRNESDPDELARLRRRLEMAEFVGD